VSYRHDYDHLVVKGSDRKNLQISWDFEDNIQKRFPILLFTPDLNDASVHYHISLNMNEAMRLKDWLVLLKTMRRLILCMYKSDEAVKPLLISFPERLNILITDRTVVIKSNFCLVCSP